MRKLALSILFLFSLVYSFAQVTVVDPRTFPSDTTIQDDDETYGRPGGTNKRFVMKYIRKYVRQGFSGVVTVNALTGDVQFVDDQLAWAKLTQPVRDSIIAGKKKVRLMATKPGASYLADMCVDTVGVDSIYFWNTSSYKLFQAGSGGVTDGNKVDLTVSGNTWTINNGVINNGKLAANAVDSTKAANLSPNDIAQTGASTNDVLTWTGSKYAPRPGSAGQASIQFKDEGSDLGTQGTVTAVDVTGAGATASRSGNTVTINVPGGGGSGGTPTGPAGGSLTGTYPDPTFAANTVGNTQVINKSLDSTDIKNRGLALLQLNPSGASNGQIPKYNSTTGNWEPAADNGGGTSLSSPTVTLSVTSNTEISVSWAAIVGAESYVVERSTTVGFSTAIFVAETKNLSYANLALAPNATYYFRVKARGVGYVDSNYSTIVNATTRAGFNADTIAGQVLFWDITDAASLTLSGGYIDQINDKGTGNNDVDQSASPSTRAQYFATGGPGNKPYAKMVSGRELGKPLGGGLSITTTPASIYLLMKIESVTDNIAFLDYSGNAGLRMLRLSNPNLGSLRIYTGITPFYSNTSGTTPSYRRDWQLVKIVLKDDDSFWIEINDEPVMFRQDGAGAVALAINRMLLYNSSVAQIRIFNKELPPSSDRMLKQWYVETFGLKTPEKIILTFGDSHTLSGYVQQVEAKTAWKFYNRAISGTKVYEGSNPLSAISPPYAKKEYSKFWLHFQYGTNDAVSPGYTWDTWKQNYKAQIQTFINAGFDPRKIIIATPPFSTGGYVSGNIDEVATKVREISKELGIHLADWYEAMKNRGYDCNGDGGSGDGIHANSASHALAANELLKILESERQSVIPIFTTIQRDSVFFFREGDVIFNSTLGVQQNYVGGTWVTVGSPSGTAGGVLTGTYPNPGLATDVVSGTNIQSGSIPVGDITASGTPSSTTYLRGDGTWNTPAGGGGSPGGANNQIQVNDSGIFGARDSVVVLNNPDKVGIGTPAPSADRLEVRGLGTSTRTNTLITDGSGNAALRILDNRTTTIYAPSSTTGGLTVESTLSGNTGTFYIRPRATPIGSAPHFSMGVGAGGRLDLDVYELRIINTGALSCGAITSTGAIIGSTGTFSGNYIQFAPSSDNTTEKWFYHSWNSPSDAKAGMVFKPTGAWSRADIGFGQNNGANTSPVTSSLINLWVRSAGHVEVVNNLSVGFTSAPSAKLHVLGDCIITSTLWYNAAKTVGTFTGTGSPEGVVTASVGSVFLRTDGAVGTTVYYKNSGAGNTGWAASYTYGDMLFNSNFRLGAWGTATTANLLARRNIVGAYVSPTSYSTGLAAQDSINQRYTAFVANSTDGSIIAKNGATGAQTTFVVTPTETTTDNKAVFTSAVYTAGSTVSSGTSYNVPGNVNYAHIDGTTIVTVNLPEIVSNPDITANQVGIGASIDLSIANSSAVVTINAGGSDLILIDGTTTTPAASTATTTAVTFSRRARAVSLNLWVLY